MIFQSQLPIINARMVHAPAKPHALKRLKIDFYPPLNLPAQTPTYYDPLISGSGLAGAHQPLSILELPSLIS